MRRLAVATALAFAILPAAAGASAYTAVLHTYQVDGSIPPCRFTSVQLSSALKGIDTYGQQYFADFSNAIQNALAARASGVCNPAALRAALAGHAVSGTPAPALPASLTAPTDSGVPAPILAMAAIALTVAIVLGVRALALAGGWEPRWTIRWRHAWGEAGYRVSGGWADFLDWLRLRR